MSRVKVLSDNLMRSPHYLQLDEKRAEEAAEALKDYPISLPAWNFEGFYPQSDNFEEMCLFYLVFNSINYCFFDEYGSRFSDGDVHGSSLVSKKLTVAWDTIKDPHFLQNVDENYLLSELFPAESPIPMVKERTEALREVGRFIVNNPDFSFSTFFRKYKQNAYFVSQAIPHHLPTWRDPFFKRAQLFVGMVYGRFQDWTQLPINSGLEDLTVFADYRVPQTMHAMGIIRPGLDLDNALRHEVLIESQTRLELEIRAATVAGADQLLHFLRHYRGDPSLNALHVDYILWSAARKKEDMPDGVFVRPWLPHHLTITTDY